MRDHASMGGSALAVAIAIASVTALNLAIAPDAAEKSLDRAAAAVGRAGRYAVAEVTRRLGGDRDEQDDVDRDAVDDERAPRWRPCRPRMRWHEHWRFRPCDMKIRCETHDVHGHPHVVCGAPT